MIQNPFQRPPYYDWGLDRWKIGAALLLFGVLFFWLLKTPPTSQLPGLPTPVPITLTDPQPGSLDVTAAQIFRGTAPANSPVAVMDAQLGELGRTLSQADGRWTLETGSTWAAGAYRLQAVTLSPLTGQPVDASVVVPVVALSSPLPPLRLESADLSQNGSFLLLSGQAPPGVMVSVLAVDGDQRTPLGQAQADRDAHWQLQSSRPATNPFQVMLVAQDPTGEVLAESDSIEVVLPGLLTVDVTATAVASLPTAIPTDQPTIQPPPSVIAEVTAPPITKPTTNPTTNPTTSPILPFLLGLDTLGPGSQVADKTIGQLTGTGQANQSVEVSARYYPPGESVIDPLAVAETILGTTVADSAGRWQLPLASPLAWGRYELFVRQADQAGQPVAQVGPISVQVLAPGVSPAQDLPVILAPGMNSAVAQAPLDFVGTALAASRLRLEFLAGPESLPDLPSAQVWVANDGRWAVELGEILPPGRYQVVAVALDPAGEESGRSAPVDFEVIGTDMTAQAIGPTPTRPIVPDVVPEVVPEIVADTATQMPGSPAPITVGTRFPRFSGQAEPNRLLWVQIVDGAGNTQQGYVSAGADGRWTFVPVFPLASGVTKATVQVVGATVTARDDLTAQIPEGAGLSGALATGLQVIAPPPGLLANRLPPIYGLTAPGTQVSVRINEQVVATAQADIQGNWYALPPAALAVGEHWLVVRDDRGNEVGPLILTVTDQTPTLPAPALDPIPARVDTARSALLGVAQPGQDVVIVVNGVPAATVTADASGRWRWQPATAQAEGPVYVQARILGADGSVISESAVQVVVYFVPLGG
jgi:hypothetical protein